MKENRLKARTNSFINSSNRLTSTCHHQVIYLVCRECQQTQPFRSCPWAWHCFFTWNMILSYLLAQNHRRCYVSNQTRQRHDTSYNSVHPVSDQPEVFFVVNRKCGTFCKGNEKVKKFSIPSCQSVQKNQWWLAFTYQWCSCQRQDQTHWKMLRKNCRNPGRCRYRCWKETTAWSENVSRFFHNVYQNHTIIKVHFEKCVA